MAWDRFPGRWFRMPGMFGMISKLAGERFSAGRARPFPGVRQSSGWAAVEAVTSRPRHSRAGAAAIVAEPGAWYGFWSDVGTVYASGVDRFQIPLVFSNSILLSP